MGMNTNESFAAVLARIATSRTRPDLVVASGDLVHDGSQAGYLRMADSLAELGVPVYCMPGNHDEKQRLRDLLACERHSGVPVCLQGVVEWGDWKLILVDTVVTGEKSGRISSRELRRVKNELESPGADHVMLFLHHQPVPVGSVWLDTMQVENADDFFDLVHRHDNIRGISWGHVHQDFEEVRNGVLYTGTPSTCIQFARGSVDFAIDEIPPGWR